MYFIVIFLSLVSSLTVGFFYRLLGFYYSSILSTCCLIFFFFLSVFCFYEVFLLGCNVYIKVATWMNSEVLNLDWGFMFDSLTTIMCCVVTFISCLVHLYLIEYMSHEFHLSLFTFFMPILVTADNFIQMFVKWKSVGLCSYLLINFWFIIFSIFSRQFFGKSPFLLGFVYFFVFYIFIRTLLMFCYQNV